MATLAQAQDFMRHQGKALRALQSDPDKWWNASQMRRVTGWAGKGEIDAILRDDDRQLLPGVLRRINEKGNPEWCWDRNVPPNNGIV